MVKTIGIRMRQARELCNLSQNMAAKRLGYSNSSKLSKIEGATDTNSVPLWLILRASQIYEVSVDFLFGITDDWETGARMTQERNVSGWLFNVFNGEVSKWSKEVRSINDRIECLTKAVTNLAKAVDEIDSAMSRFAEINKEFKEDMRGGATLIARIENARIIARNAMVSMRRFHCELRVATARRMPYVGDGDSPIKNLFSDME